MIHGPEECYAFLERRVFPVRASAGYTRIHHTRRPIRSDHRIRESPRGPATPTRQLNLRPLPGWLTLAGSAEQPEEKRIAHARREHCPSLARGAEVEGV